MERRDFVKAAALAGGASGVAAVAGLSGCSEGGGENKRLEELAAKIDDLSARLWVAEAKEAIRYKLCLYCRGDDRQDAELGKRAFAEDSRVDYGTSPDFGEIFKGTGWEWVDHCVEGDKAITAAGGFYAHELYNIAITVNGNKAGSETYVNAPVMTPNGDGTYTVQPTVARYCDKWECRDGDWVIVERITTNDYGWYLASSGLYAPYGGSFDKDDPSYEALAYGE